jgi:hypothetical protein
MRINSLGKTLLLLSLAAGAGPAARAQSLVFQPGKLAVLQLGDGGPGRCLPLGATSGITNYNASDIATSRQTQLFIDQFDPLGVNQTAPAVQVAIPTNGQTAMLINGNAGTEGNLTLAGDRSRVAFTGYQGDILSITTGQQTAPSNLSYDRGIGTVDAFGSYDNPYRGGGWYGIATGKTNPRGVATDGAGRFWGCGNGYGSLYFAETAGGQPIQFQNIALTSCAQVINDAVYASVKSSESVNLYPAGVYSFVDFFNNPVPYPSAASFLHLEIQAAAGYTTCVGFDINPQKTIAYLADTSKGVQKYVRSGLSWSLAYNLSIPGYYGLGTGVLTNAASTNVLVGCFSVAVDWSGANPVVYATTTDSGWNSGNPYYGNRVIRINDTNTVTSGANIVVTTNMNILTTVVRPAGTGPSQLTNIVYKAVTFTPDLRPVITSQPASWSAAVGDNVAFSVGATSPYALSYQWVTNGTAVSGATGSTLSVNSVDLTYDGNTYVCVVSNDYGAVTSAVATLHVTATATPPVLGALQNLTNFVGNGQSITVTASGTDPKGGYQWFHNGAPLSDGGNYSGTTTPTLSLTQLATTDAGVYSAIVTNVAGSASNAVANLTVSYAAPVMIQPPVPVTTYLGRTVTNTASAYGQLLNYQWYTSTAAGGSRTPLSDSAHYSGTATPALTINNILASDATNYLVIISNPGGSITSAPVALSATVAPPHYFINYTAPGQSYTQTFNSLPIPGGSSAEGANPLHITYSMTNIPGMLTNGSYGLGTLSAEVQYSTDNPLDFGYPIFAAGGIGGLGLSNTMPGWYGWAGQALVFAATKGDQSQGAVVDDGGIYYGDGAPLTGITNRALGLIATTKTGPIAFGAAFYNKSTNTYTTINLSYTGELWRNNPTAQPLLFGYVIDPAGSNSVFQVSQWDSTNGIYYVPALNVTFPTSVNTEVLDGTQPANQTSLAASSLSISNWTPGATLWLVWQATTLGSAQNLAIDNLAFSAATAAVTVTPPRIGGITMLGNGSFQFAFTNTPGASFRVLGTNNVQAPVATWPLVGYATEVSAGQYQFTDAQATNSAQKFYVLVSP